MELREKFEFTKSAVKMQGEITMTLKKKKKKKFTWFKWRRGKLETDDVLRNVVK
jgi:succinate dehydrogenase flavin-adding protein (antitoxin of CptAB toxin-antitoxin module)